MNAKEIIEKIRLLFADEPAPGDPPAPVAPEPKSYTLQDGTTLKVTALEVGADAMIDDAPAPAGGYLIEDGSTIVVGDDSKIAEIQPKIEDAPVDPPAPDAPAPVDMSAQFAEIKQELSSYKQDFESYKAANEQRFGEQKATIEKQGAILAQMFELVEALTKAPSQDPPVGVVKARSSFSKVELKNDKLAKFAEAAQKIAEELK